jgi:hypothetical protein
VTDRHKVIRTKERSMRYCLILQMLVLSITVSSCASKTPVVEPSEVRTFASEESDMDWALTDEDEKRDENISKLRKLAKGGRFYFEVQFAFIATTPNYSKIDRLVSDLEADGNKVVPRYGIRSLGFSELATASFEFEGSLKETDLTPEKLVKRLDGIAKWQFIQLEK